MAERQRKREALDEQAVQQVATAIAPHLEPPLVLYLQGELGAGKTTFARALIQALGYEGKVKSPTYGLLEHYRLGGMEVLHLDLYRVDSSDELEFLGISDLADSNTILLVEWPERGSGALPSPDLTIRFLHDGDRRMLEWQAHSSSGNYLCHFFETFL